MLMVRIDDPAINGIVFSNFMNKGFHISRNRHPDKKNKSELKSACCEVRKCALVQAVKVENGQVVAVHARSQNTGVLNSSKEIQCRCTIQCQCSKYNSVLSGESISMKLYK